MRKKEEEREEQGGSGAERLTHTHAHTHIHACIDMHIERRSALVFSWHPRGSVSESFSSQSSLCTRH